MQIDRVHRRNARKKVCGPVWQSWTWHQAWQRNKCMPPICVSALLVQVSFGPEKDELFKDLSPLLRGVISDVSWRKGPRCQFLETWPLLPHVHGRIQRDAGC